MAIGDIFKKKDVEEKAEKKAPVKVEKKPAPVKVRKEGQKKSTAYAVLKIPHITEKATDLNEKNQYVFKVFPKANKTEIRKSVEDVYNVDVLNVKIVNVHPKKKMRGGIVGEKSGYKKAVVKIKAGQKIELLPR